jgi:integrase
LNRLKPAAPGERYHRWDAACPNLGVRVSDTGRITFYFVRRVQNQPNPRWIRLGRYPYQITLAEARARTKELLQQITEGHDPKAIAAAKRRETAARKTFGDIAGLYITYIENGTLRTGPALIGTIRRELLPVFGSYPIADITRQDIVGFVNDIIERGKVPTIGKRKGGQHAARNSLAVMRTLCAWALEAGHIDADPCGHIRKPSSLHGLTKYDLQRSRVLSDSELKSVWRAAGQMNYPFGPLVKLLILLGNRLRELSEAKWDELDEAKAELVIPAERIKMKRPFVVPLSSLTMGIITSLPRFDGYIFTTTAGVKPFTGFTAPKSKLDELSGVTGYTLHDLRRTCRTGLSALGTIKDEVCEAIIGHTVQGIKGVYNRYDYYAEKRAGLESWSRRVQSIVGDNVLPLKEQRRARL